MLLCCLEWKKMLPSFYSFAVIDFWSGWPTFVLADFLLRSIRLLGICFSEQCWMCGLQQHLSFWQGSKHDFIKGIRLRCTRRISQSFRLLQICIVLCLLLNIHLDVHTSAQNTAYTCFCIVNHKGRNGLINGQKGANFVKNMKYLFTNFYKLNTMHYWWHYFLIRFHSYTVYTVNQQINVPLWN